jgi:hypothetical protein
MNLVEEKIKNNNLSNANKQENVNLPRKQKILIKKNLVDKIHKLIIKELKLNVNYLGEGTLK